MIPPAYGSLADRDARFRAAGKSAGADFLTFGKSVEGRPLEAALAPTSTTAAWEPVKVNRAPLVFVNGNIHGIEWIAAEAAIGVLAAWNTDAWADVRARADLVVAPCLNPDGAARTERQGGVGTIKELRTNAHGVDLNRNFPMPHGAKPFFLTATGSSDPARATFRGTAPFSEPEAKGVDSLVEMFKPRLTISFHSFMGTVIPPKVTTSPHARTYRALGRAWRRGQTHFIHWTLMSTLVDVFTGELEDRVHHVHDGWALTVELWPVWRSFAAHVVAPSLFARFNPSDPAIVVADAVAGAKAAILFALDLPRPSELTGVTRSG